MSGDYSRNTFKARKNFSGVLMQQGRVQLDADWNEQVEIDDRRWRTETVDIIGRAVAPKETQDAFKIELSSGDLLIHSGRMYVDGLLAENHGKEPTTFNTVLDEDRGTQPVPYNEQPYLPELPDLPTNGTHMVFLDVWRREVTHLKDPDMVEPAVGVDTTTRMQTVWQVKVLELDGAGNLDCDDEPDEWKALIEPSAGRLSTSTIQAPSDPNPCLIPSTGGYRGLENRLYRVEVHKGGKLGDARFKWARHNASVETLVTSINGAKLTVPRSQWDGGRRFNIGDYVEVTDDVHELAGQAGEMRQIDDINYATKTITLNSALPSIDFPTSGAEHLTDPNRHTRIRRCDQNQGVDAEGLLEVTGPPVEIDIEDGIRIAFSIDPYRPNPVFKVGDFWHFYARTTDASVEILNDAPPRGIHHHYAKLAVVTFPGTVIDCRNHWPPQISTQGCCTVTVGRGGEYERLDEALKALLAQRHRDICICLLPGNHPFSGLEFDFPVEKSESELHLKIVGCGLGSRVFLDGPMRFTGVKAFTLRDVALELRFLAGVAEDGTERAVALDRCSEVTLTACHLAGFTAVDDAEAHQGTLLSITNADRIRLRDNIIEAALISSFEPTRKFFEQAEVDFIVELFRLPQQGVFEFEKFRLTALESARKLANLDAGERKRIHDALRTASDKDEFRTVLSSGELFSITKFSAALIAESAQPNDLFNGLIDIRRAAIKSRPGLAVVLGSELRVETLQDPALVGLDEDDYTTLEGNELIGILSLYGMPAPADFIAEIFNKNFLKNLEAQLKEPLITLTGMLGTLQMRGNQLVQIVVARHIVEQLQKKGTLFNLFGRCLMSDNVIEGATSVLVTQHLAMTANEFTLRVLEIDGEAGIQRTVAIVAADSSIYVGNHGEEGNVVLRNASRANSQAANLLEITIA